MPMQWYVDGCRNLARSDESMQPAPRQAREVRPVLCGPPEPRGPHSEARAGRTESRHRQAQGVHRGR
jgi:hypothetical protein